MRTLIFALAAYDDQRLLRDAPPQQQMRLEGWRPKQPLPFEEWLQTPAGRHADELMKAAGSRGEPGSAGGYRHYAIPPRAAR
jgi:hypothetical protein